METSGLFPLSNFHLSAAKKLAQLAEEAEVAFDPSTARSWPVEPFAQVVATILSAVAALESAVNEFLADPSFLLDRTEYDAHVEILVELSRLKLLDRRHVASDSPSPPTVGAARPRCANASGPH